jgi:four helix bundle protein
MKPAGQGKRDFIAKMSISSKESRETAYWLRLLQKSEFIEYDLEPLIQRNLELVRMLTAIVKTSQTK